MSQFERYYQNQPENFDHYIVYQSPYEKIRLGKKEDGGYVICEMGDVYDICLSCGVENDISFDEDFLEKYPKQTIHAFDGTIQKMPKSIYNKPIFEDKDIWIPVSDYENEWIQIGNLCHEPGILHKENYGDPIWGRVKNNYHNYRPFIGIMCPQFEIILNRENLTWHEIMEKYNNENTHIPTSQEVRESLPNKRLQFIRKNISNINSLKTTNLQNYVENYQNIFLKMDIENWENVFFESLSDEDLLKFKQIVIEFHSPRQLIIPQRLNKTHWLVHFHSNNHAPLYNINGIHFPDTFECTYIRKENDSLPLNQTPFPIPHIDYPNKVGKDDYILQGYPFSF